jgi:hypothetical protein
MAKSYEANHIRRTNSDIAAIRDTIVGVIEADPPMTVRQVFYQLVTRGVVEKTETEYDGTVCRLMVKMRIDALPYDWVVDESAGFATPKPSTALPTP